MNDLERYVNFEKSLKKLKENIKEGLMSKEFAKYTAEFNLARLKDATMLLLIHNSCGDTPTKMKTLTLAKKMEELETRYEEFISSLTNNLEI